MDSPTAQDALRRVTEAEQRIRRLAKQVQGNLHGSPAAAGGGDDALSSPEGTPPPQHLAPSNGTSYARTPQRTPSEVELLAERTDKKYALLEHRVRTLEGTVAALREELASVRRQQHSGQAAAAAAAALHDPEHFNELVLRSLSEIPKAVSGKSIGSGSTAAQDSIARQEAVRYVHTTFDLDSDGYLNFEDSARMQEVTEGATLRLEDYQELCRYFNVNPDRGFDIGDLHRMYTDSTMESDIERDFEKARSFRREHPVASDLRTVSPKAS